MIAYYNEIDPYCAQWLRNLIVEDLIPFGVVDERDIKDVPPHELAGYSQCHFFAGVGGWPLALRMAGWDDDREVWTGSCPCQPFSTAGRRLGFADERHLWPEFYRLIRECRPAVVFGEQVAGKTGLGWLDGVFADLEGSGYACGAAVVPACSVGAPHRRERLWFVAQSEGWRGDGPLLAGQRQTLSGAMGPSEGNGSRPLADAGGGSVRHGGRAEAVGATQALPREARQQRLRPDAGATGGGGCSPLADTNLPGPREGREQRGGQLGGAGGDQEARALVDAASERRGEGRAEPELRSGRPAATSASLLGDADSAGPQEPAGERGDTREERAAAFGTGGGGFWSDAIWLTGADGKSRRAKPGVRLLVNGLSDRVAKLRAFGNAIVPQAAALFIEAYIG